MNAPPVRTAPPSKADRLFFDAFIAAAMAEPSPDPVRVLTTGDDAHLVEAGLVDVFAVLIDQDGGQIGVRRHLFACGAGELVFDLPPCTDMQVVAIPRAGGVLRSLPSPIFWNTAGQPMNAPLAARPIDLWIERLTTTVIGLGELTVPVSTTISAGVQTQLQAGGKIAVERELAWCRLEGGNSLLFGAGLVPAGQYAPLCGRGWLHATTDTTVLGVDTRSILRAGALAPDFAAFGGICVTLVAEAMARIAAGEAQRLVAQRDRLDGDMQRIRNDLVGLIDARPAERLGDSSDQHLFAALRAVAAAIGVTAKPPATVNSVKGTARQELDYLLQPSGLRARRLRLDGKWWQDDNGPLLGFRKDGSRPVALIPKLGGGYTAEDPAAGTRVKVTPAIASGLAADAYMIYQGLPAGRLTFKSLIQFGHQQTIGDLTMLLLTIGLGSALAIAPPLAVDLIFSNLIPGHRTNLLVQLGSSLVLVGGLTAFAAWCGDIASLRLQTRLGLRTHAAIWDRILRMPVNVFSRFTAADLAGRVGALEGALAAIRSTFVSSSRALGTMIASLGTMFWFDAPAAFGALALLGILAVATAAFSAAQVHAFKAGAQSTGLVNSFLLEITTSIAKLRLAGAEVRALIIWGDKFSIMRRRMIRSRMVGNLFTGFTAGYALFATGAVFAIIGLQKDDALDTGSFMAFLTAFAGALAAAGQMANTCLNLAFQMSSSSYYQPLLETAPTTAPANAAVPKLRGAIEANNLFYRYAPDGEAVLTGVSFKVSPGQFIAVAGPSGSGKTTLLRLLLGIDRPQSGAIFYDNQDLRGLDPDSLRQQIGTVLQRPQLFSGTLHENIRGASDADDDTIHWAIRMVGLDQEIDELPMGLQTRVGDGAQGFSGGQIQRLAIARTLVRRPSILLFDEATSALDNATQAKVSHGLQSIAATRLVIAHRLSTIRNADRILVMDKGRVVENGTFDELMKAKGLFSQMANRQLI
jgi:NHLM bacteriocin system ABC transporter ATP-binding protein